MLTLPPPPHAVAPDDGAAGVDGTTDFVFDLVPGAVHEISVYVGQMQYDISATTHASSVDDVVSPTSTTAGYYGYDTARAFTTAP